MGIFKKAKESKQGLKVLGYGASGTGKTTFALSFDSGKICAIDSEDGMAWYKDKCKALEYILNSTSAEDVEEALEEIEDKLINEISTFVLDSETKIYENMQHSALNIAEKRAKNKQQSVDDANISQREWGKIKLINKRMQAAKIMLASKGINIVSIAQEKEIKEKKGDSFVVVGYAPDTAKGFEYDYDVVLRFFTEVDKKTGELIYKAEVKKDRTQTFQRGEIIINPSYTYWSKQVEKKAKLEEDVRNYSKDIEKDQSSLQLELENLADLQNEFKEVFKNSSVEQKKVIKAVMQKIGITNPLECDDTEKMKELIAAVRKL